MRALAVLGLPLEKPVFPSILQCPHCQQNTLYVFDDILTDGLWLNCTGCSCHGDIITFGAGIWNTSLPDTLTKFSDFGLVSVNDATRAIGDYDRAITKQKAFEEFWTTAEEQLWNHGDDFIACRLRDFGIKNEINGCYGLVGVAHYDQITKICSTMGRAKPPKLREDGAAIVLPFYDLPGRLTGVLIKQYNEENESKQIFISHSGYKRQKPEAGYFLLKQLIGPCSALFKGTQFVSDDPLWVLQLQCDSLARHMQPLPLAASYSGPDAESYGQSWVSLPNGVRIFHSTIVSPELISRACNAKGYAAVVPVPAKIYKPYGLSIDRNITARLSNIRRHAKTWQKSLYDSTSGVSELSAQTFMQKLTVPHDKLSIFIEKYADNFSKDFKDRVLSSVRMALAAPTKTSKKRIIIERDSGWWNQMGQQISNARVVITKVLQADTGDKVYCGNIYMDNQEYAFSDSAKRIERMGLLAYTAAVMAPHGKLVIFDRSWNRSSHMSAIQLHPPKLINVSTKSGWDENTLTFRFAKYELTSSGEIHPTHMLAKQDKVKAFPEPTEIAPLPIRELLTPAHENSFVWAFTSAVICNLIAPILRRDNIATAIDEDNFETAQRLGAVLSCNDENSTVLTRKNSYHFLNALANENWPTLGCSAFNDDVFNPHTPKYFNRPLLFRMLRPQTAVAIGYGWQAIKTSPCRLQYDFDSMRYILPTYIQKTLKTRLNAFNGCTNIHQAVLVDMHDWLNKIYGVTFNLAHAQRLMAYPENAHVELIQELNYAISAGNLHVLPAARKRKQKLNYLIRKKDYWWLNRKAVDGYFYSTRSVNPNWLTIIDLMQQDGVYGGEDVVHNMHGILVKTEWCDQFLMPAGESLEKETG